MYEGTGRGPGGQLSSTTQGQAWKAIDDPGRSPPTVILPPSVLRTMSTPSEAELAEFQAQAALSMAFLRNLVGRHVEGYTPPTAEELAQSDACVLILGVVARGHSPAEGLALGRKGHWRACCIKDPA